MEGIKVCQLWGEGNRGMQSARKDVAGNSFPDLNSIVKNKNSPFAKIGALFILQEENFHNVNGGINGYQCNVQ